MAAGSQPAKRKLGREWDKLNSREVKWKMAFSADLSIDQIHRGTRFSSAGDYEGQIKKHLPRLLKNLEFKVDLATQDRGHQPHGGRRETREYLQPLHHRDVPGTLRDLYAISRAGCSFSRLCLSHDHDERIAAAAEKTLSGFGEISRTNI